MNTIQTYTGPSLFNTPHGMEPTKLDLAHRVQVLSDILQDLIEYIGQKNGIKLNIIALPHQDGVRMAIVEHKNTIPPPLPQQHYANNKHSK